MTHTQTQTGCTCCVSHKALVEACKEMFELFRECTTISYSSIHLNFAPDIDTENKYDYLFKKTDNSGLRVG